jgi:hypothetical protein
MLSRYKEINFCEVCDNDELKQVLDLGLHPMCDDLVELKSDRKCDEYPINILFCNQCNTAHQKYQVPKQNLFPDSYHYRSRFTKDVLDGMQALVSSCESKFIEFKNKKVLDIGCNDGSLLDFFKKKKFLTIGIEPTGAYKDAKDKGHEVYNDFLSPKLANQIIKKHGSPDFITFTNVFAHIENLQEVIDSLNILLGPKTILVIENHYLGAIIEKNQFDTFYHEHPRTYSLKSFQFIAKKLNANLIASELTSRYGGNIRIFITQDPNFSRKNLFLNEDNLAVKFLSMQDSVSQWIKKKKKFINDFVEKNGKIRAKAFPGRAAILIKLLELSDKHISAVYEKDGSMKIGHYLPGTRIPILPDSDLFGLNDQAKPILNLAWHISSEIKQYLSKNMYEGEVIDIISDNDFL